MGTEALKVKNEPTYVAADESDRKKIVNKGPDALYYGTGPNVSSLVNTGSLASGADLDFAKGIWVLSTGRSRCWVEQVDEEREREFTSVRDFGAVTDGDAAGAIQAAINNTPAGGTLYFPAGTYTLGSALTISRPIHLDLGGAVLDWSGVTGTLDCLQVVGTEGTPVSLTANAAQSATSLSIAAGAETGFAAGDWVRVGSTTNWSPTSSPTGEIDQAIGEFVQVASTASGSLTLAWGLLGGAYNTAATAAVSKITFVEGVTITGGELRGKAGENHDAIFLDKAKHVRVRGTKFTNFSARSVPCTDCIDVVVEGVTIEGGPTSLTPHYAVSAVHASQDITFRDSTVIGCRHAITTGGSLARSGITDRIRVINVTAIDTVNASFDSHAGCRSFHVEGCTSIRSATYGIAARCPSATIVNNHVIRSTERAIYCRNQSSQPTAYTITGNETVDCAEWGIGVRDASDAELVGTTAGQSVRHIVIANNSIKGGTGGIMCWGPAAGDWSQTGVTITGNTIRGVVAGAGDGCISLLYVEGATVSGNSCPDTGVDGNIVRWDNCDNITVSGNTGKYTSTASTSAFRSTVSTHCTVTGNECQNAATGVSLDADCQFFSFSGNDFRGCTTVASILGSGHRRAGNLHPVTAVASAASLALPDFAEYVSVTGTTTITSIEVGLYQTGTLILRLQGVCQVTDNNGTLDLAGNFTGPGTLSLATDGTNWYETARAAL